MQGTINLPEHPSHDSFSSEERGDEPVLHETPIGRLVFPDYDPSAGKEDTKWMKRVYLYVGMHQRLPGEVKKLPKPLAVLRKAEKNGGRKEGQDGDGEVEELQIVEIVKWKILFSQRPEPVGTWAGEG
jgi:chromosome transmission fidelity protein 8